MGLVLLCATAACGSDARDELALTTPSTSVPTIGIAPAPAVSGSGVPSVSASPQQKLGAAAYTTSTTAPKAATATTAAKPANPAGWGSPVMVQDFNGSSLPAQWGTYDSPNGTPPRSGDMVSVSNGMLHIAGGVNSRVGKDVGGGVMYLKAQKYGRWEVRFRAQAGAGYGAFVLLWPQNNEDWPTVGEIDLAEVVASDRSTFGTFLHHGSANHQVGLDATKADFTEFHTVAVEWLPTRVTYYLDGKKFFNVTPSQIETGLPTESAMNLAMQLDQGCGGYIACRNGSTPSRVVMDVDWVRVYQAP
ncbi:glycoside hydrolase family 16 protein [Paractinoplanes durhamensis]|uniref:glycoside hydrolase family 16 protein n=1 Tax=Paractinoplanes durhamensis TaxID=113563 RepID=UPI00194151F9|nr:glycoside hydrolase family 16 protein [Actinoplanes durhamensis]